MLTSAPLELSPRAAEWERGPAFDLSVIAARAMTLGERLALGARYRADVADVDNATSSERRADWVRTTGGGDSRVLARRLAWDGIAPEQAHWAISGEIVHEGTLPDWVGTASRICGAAMDIAANGWPDVLPPPTRPTDPLPFEELLHPVVLVARRELASRWTPGADVLTEAAHADLERALLGRLCRTAARAIHEAFVAALPLGRRLQRSTASAIGSNSSAYYEAFVAEMSDAGLIPLFETYPVLARLLATVVEQYVDASAELVERVASDIGLLGETLLSHDSPVGLGRVSAIEPHLSDFHHRGRSVAALTFEDGTRVVYKPKSLAPDVAFGALVEWCNSRGAEPRIAMPRVNDRGSYGWAAFVAPADCTSSAAASRYHERAGMLLALIHALGGTDCHRGNIVAAGEHLVVVDLETLLHPEARSMSGDEHVTDAMHALVRRFRDSILRTGLVPRWDIDGDGEAFDVSGLVDGDVESRMQDLRWHSVGTDAIDLALASIDAPPDTSTPTLLGISLSAGSYVGEIVAGFERMYRLLMDHRAELLSAHGPLAAFSDCPARFIFRPTLVYAQLRDKALSPRALRHGVAHSIELEALGRGFLSCPDRPQAWPIFAAEVEAMERLDVPCFSATADSATLTLGDGTIPRYFEAPAFYEAITRIASMDESDLARQLEMLRLSFHARAARDVEPSTVSASPAHSESADGEITNEALLECATSIAVDLANRAVRGGDGSAAWVDIALTQRAERYQVQPVGVSLYDGATGIALFLAALERATGNRQHHALALGAVMQARRIDRRGQRLGIGGITGLGSVVYALVRVAELLDEPSLLDDASRIAALIDDHLIAADDQLDVMSGSAGALLALLALYGATGDELALKNARACSERLLKARVAVNGAPPAWPTQAGKQLAGLSHGASGISYALLRLYSVTGDSKLLRAANDGLAFERHLYSEPLGAWPDRRTNGAARYSSSWCNGAAGIALARAGAAAIVGAEAVKEDMMNAIRVVSQAGWNGVDHLCCGGAGRIEALLVAARQFDAPSVRNATHDGARALLGRRLSPSRFRLYDNLPDSVYSPGFFRGTAGIGYQMLRLARPAVLPSALLME